jgi:hypothetical protein
VPNKTFSAKWPLARLYKELHILSVRLRWGPRDCFIRLVGIDAPEASHSKNELGQPFSDHVTKRLASLVLNRSVEIKAYGQDDMGAPALGLDLGPYWKVEEQARNARKGMWQLRGQIGTGGVCVADENVRKSVFCVFICKCKIL